MAVCACELDMTLYYEVTRTEGAPYADNLCRADADASRFFVVMVGS